MTKIEPIDSISEHVTNETPLNNDINKFLAITCVQDHRDTTALLSRKINDKLFKKN